jgi:hypothetical protein
VISRWTGRRRRTTSRSLMRACRATAATVCGARLSATRRPRADTMPSD